MKLLAFFMAVNLYLLQGYYPQQADTTKKLEDKEEHFDKFFKNFCQSTKFQIERIKFPLRIVVVDEENRTEKLIQQNEWRHTNLLKLKREHSKNTLETIDKGDEARDVIFTRQDTGEVVHHLFSRIDNQWFLVSIIDESK